MCVHERLPFTEHPHSHRQLSIIAFYHGSGEAHCWQSPFSTCDLYVSISLPFPIAFKCVCVWVWMCAWTTGQYTRCINIRHWRTEIIIWIMLLKNSLVHEEICLDSKVLFMLNVRYAYGCRRSLLSYSAFILSVFLHIFWKLKDKDQQSSTSRSHWVAVRPIEEGLL